MRKHCKKKFLDLGCTLQGSDLKHDRKMKGDVIRQCKDMSGGESVLRFQIQNQNNSEAHQRYSFGTLVDSFRIPSSQGPVKMKQ